jgi:hypothetical protein
MKQPTNQSSNNCVSAVAKLFTPCLAHLLAAFILSLSLKKSKMATPLTQHCLAWETSRAHKLLHREV